MYTTEGYLKGNIPPFHVCLSVCLGTAVTMTAEAIKCAVNSEAADSIDNSREIVDYCRT